jgi:ApbE superfamily uncharacterized protein (UPF0280 family)
MQDPVATLLSGGKRLHLQHGPIDLIIGVDAETEVARQRAFTAARDRFDTVLTGLVSELAMHRSALTPDTPLPKDATAKRMYHAARPFCRDQFLTPMIAVAGAVADEVLDAMLAVGPLRRAYVNNGGDIAVHLTEDATFSVAMAQVQGRYLGRIQIDAPSGIRGIATSGAGGRSFSLGIAESVTVLARTAAAADVAATLICNACDLPGHPAVTRACACDLAPDSDLGRQPVVTAVASLTAKDRATALAAGRRHAETLCRDGQIIGAALFLQGASTQTGDHFPAPLMEIEHV